MTPGELDELCHEAALVGCLLAAADELAPPLPPWRSTLRGALRERLDALLYVLADASAGGWAPASPVAELLVWRWTGPVWRCSLPREQRADGDACLSARLAARAALSEWSAGAGDELTAEWAREVEEAQAADAAHAREVALYLSARRAWACSWGSDRCDPPPAEPAAPPAGGGALLLGVAPHLALPTGTLPPLPRLELAPWPPLTPSK